MYRRPNMRTSYEADSQIFPTILQKVLIGVFGLIVVLMPFDLPVINQIPFVRFLGDPEWIRPVTLVFALGIAALGLNILSGVAGQVSLGHAFFMGVGASTAVLLGGSAGTNTWGLELPMWVWLPGSGIAAVIVGIIVSPVAVRLRGLYLAIVTLGLVFLGIHFGNTSWGTKIAGPPALGRTFPDLELKVWKEEDPLVNVSSDGQWLWFDASEEQKRYLFYLALLVVFALVAKNLVRTRTGRALQAIRDRDIAAEVMGVAEFRYKVIAFAISSFFAGVGGALFASHTGIMLAEQYNLFLSVEFIAILLIGGAGTVSGTLIGTFFVVMMPKFVEELTRWLDSVEGGFWQPVADFLLTEGDDFGVVHTSTVTPGWQLSVFDWNIVLFGVLIVVFLIAEPLGLYGIWIKVRNYWKMWPFSY